MGPTCPSVRRAANTVRPANERGAKVCNAVDSSGILSLVLNLVIGNATSADQSVRPWVTYAGGEGPGAGKHVVLVSGDEEYRSEEALPQLGKILARHHGFKATVLFAVDPETGEIDPENRAQHPRFRGAGGRRPHDWPRCGFEICRTSRWSK